MSARVVAEVSLLSFADSSPTQPPTLPFARFMEEKLRQKDTSIEKLRLKNSTIKAQIAKMEQMLAHKEEMGEVLHLVDFDQLKIENQQYLEKIEERNNELLRLKLSTSRTVQVGGPAGLSGGAVDVGQRGKALMAGQGRGCPKCPPSQGALLECGSQVPWSCTRWACKRAFLLMHNGLPVHTCRSSAVRRFSGCPALIPGATCTCCSCRRAGFEQPQEPAERPGGDGPARAQGHPGAQVRAGQVRVGSHVSCRGEDVRRAHGPAAQVRAGGHVSAMCKVEQRNGLR